METPDWLEEIDHTGDIGIRVRAASLEQLFERAAIGMFGIITDLEDVVPTESREVVVEASDRDDLLVRWLSELNYIHLVEGLLFCRFEIRRIDDRGLTAVAFGEPIDRDRHMIHTEVKAVTYHGLSIEASDGAWTAQVIFDM